MANLKKFRKLLPSATCMNLFDDSTQKKLNSLEQYFGLSEKGGVFLAGFTESFMIETFNAVGKWIIQWVSFVLLLSHSLVKQSNIMKYFMHKISCTVCAHFVLLYRDS